MNKDNYIALIYKGLKGDISLEEQSLLDIWIGDDPENEQLVNQIRSDWELTENYSPALDLELDVEADFKLLQNRIRKDNLKVAHQPIGKVVELSTKKSRFPFIGWAAAAVVVLALGIWFLNNGTNVTVEQLAMETQYAEEKEVQLPDGTKVRLNGNSQLDYPATFAADKRLVKLTGEAFFDVAKNPNKPFIIETEKANVTVLGTSFNVRARTAENEVAVVVKTGKVRLENKQGNKKVELIANQKGVYNRSSNTINQSEMNNLNDLAWFSDVLVFDNTPLKEVVLDLSKQFDVNIVISDPIMQTCAYSSRDKVSQGVENILEGIKESFEMELKVLGNTNYELIGGKCK
jgi:ferric-dicitrate binding protein FerR (iron transport regulator)